MDGEGDRKKETEKHSRHGATVYCLTGLATATTLAESA